MKKLLIPILTMTSAIVPFATMSSCSAGPQDEPVGTMKFSESLMGDELDKPGFIIENFDLVEGSKYTFTIDFSKASDSVLSQWGTSWLEFSIINPEYGPEDYIPVYEASDISIEWNSEELKTSEDRVRIIGEQEYIAFNKNKPNAQPPVSWAKTDKIKVTGSWGWEMAAERKVTILCYFWRNFDPSTNK